VAKRLFVGGLPYSVTEAELREMFAKFGAVASCTVITDKFTGQSKGFGFVEMEVDEEADKAIEALNETEIGGRKIGVNLARPLEERGPDRRGGGGFDNRRDSFRGGGGRGGGGRRGGY
jgi:RNA recognition motif-containing protein